MQDEQSQAELRGRLARLKIEHDDYHAAIDALVAQRSNPMTIQRMKKKKLALKDELERVSSAIIPDIIA